MGRRKQPPEYATARTSLARHLYYHHGGLTGRGMLANRLDMHEDLHIAAMKAGRELDHHHEPCADGETDIDLSLRLFVEAEGQDGQSNVSGDAR